MPGSILHSAVRSARAKILQRFRTNLNFETEEIHTRTLHAKLVATILFEILFASASPAAQGQREDGEARLRAAHKRANLLSTHSGGIGDVRLNCSDAKKKQTLSGLLAKLPVALPVTIRVSGACQDTVTILGFQHVTLVAEPGASISDASGQGDPVIFFSRTGTFEMQGLTINRGEVDCVDFSTCYFSENTVLNAPGNSINGNGQAGVRVRDLSMVVFPGGSDVTGNLGGTDVVCEGQFGAARDAATSINGGTSNCTPE